MALWAGGDPSREVSWVFFLLFSAKEEKAAERERERESERALPPYMHLVLLQSGAASFFFFFSSAHKKHEWKEMIFWGGLRHSSFSKRIRIRAPSFCSCPFPHWLKMCVRIPLSSPPLPYCRSVRDEWMERVKAPECVRHGLPHEALCKVRQAARDSRCCRCSCPAGVNYKTEVETRRRKGCMTGCLRLWRSVCCEELLQMERERGFPTKFCCMPPSVVGAGRGKRKWPRQAEAMCKSGGG